MPNAANVTSFLVRRICETLSLGLAVAVAGVSCGNATDGCGPSDCGEGATGGSDGGSGADAAGGAGGAGAGEGGGGGLGASGGSDAGGSAGSGGDAGGRGGEGGSDGGSGGDGGAAGGGGGGTVCEGNRLITSQAAFETLVAEQCDQVEGHLSIDGSDPAALNLATLAGLESITSAGRISVVYNAALVSIAGLDNLRMVGGYLRIEHNPALRTIARLQNLASVGGSLNIVGSALESLSGLENIESASFLILRSNDALLGLGPLASWPENVLTGEIQIYDNASLAQCEVEAFDERQTEPGARCLAACYGNEGTGTCD